MTVEQNSKGNEPGQVQLSKTQLKRLFKEFLVPYAGWGITVFAHYPGAQEGFIVRSED